MKTVIKYLPDNSQIKTKLDTSRKSDESIIKVKEVKK